MKYAWTISLFAAIISVPLMVEGSHRIGIDATSLTESRIQVNGFEEFSTHTRQSFDLPPGRYSVSYATSARSRDQLRGVDVVFEVTEAGTVDYQSSFDGVLGGVAGKLSSFGEP